MLDAGPLGLRRRLIAQTWAVIPVTARTRLASVWSARGLKALNVTSPDRIPFIKGQGAGKRPSLSATRVSWFAQLWFGPPHAASPTKSTILNLVANWIDYLEDISTGQSAVGVTGRENSNGTYHD